MMNNLTNIEYNSNDVIVLHETLEKYINDFLNQKKHRSVQTYNAYRSDINKIAKDLFGFNDYSFIKCENLEGVSIDDLVDYFDMCAQESNNVSGERKFSNKTINRRMSSLKSLLKYLSARDKIKYDVFKLDTILKSLPDDSIEIDVLEKEDALKCIEFFKTLYKGNEMYLIGKLGLDTSLRANELLTLTWKQFTVKNNEIIIKSRGSIKGKGNKDWSKEISLDLYNELEELKGDDEKVFSLNYKNIARGMRKAVDHLQLKDGKYSFHSIRKTAVTHSYYSNDNDILVAMNEANHSNPMTTMKYIKKRKNGKIGMISSREDLESDLYKEVSHEVLLEAIQQLDSISKVHLNKILDKIANINEKEGKLNKKVI